jgi:hypothetical protein
MRVCHGTCVATGGKVLTALGVNNVMVPFRQEPLAMAQHTQRYNIFIARACARGEMENRYLIRDHKT